MRWLRFSISAMQWLWFSISGQFFASVQWSYFVTYFLKLLDFLRRMNNAMDFFLRLHYVLHISVIWIRLLWDKMSGSFRVRQHSTYNIYYYFTNKLSSKFTKHKAVHAIFQTELSLIHKTVFSFIQFLDRHSSWWHPDPYLFDDEESLQGLFL